MPSWLTGIMIGSVHRHCTPKLKNLFFLHYALLNTNTNGALSHSSMSMIDNTTQYHDGHPIKGVMPSPMLLQHGVPDSLADVIISPTSLDGLNELFTG